jgi:hypothetical protein
MQLLLATTEDTNTTRQGGNDDSYSETRRPTPPRPSPAGGAWTEEKAALDLRSAADLRSAPGHNGPTYEAENLDY